MENSGPESQKSEDRKYEQGIHKHNFLCLNHMHWKKKLLLHFTMTEEQKNNTSLLKYP